MHISFAAQEFYHHSLYIRGYSPATIRRYKHVITHYVRFTGIEKLEGITEANVYAVFLNGRTERKWAAKTYVCFHTTLNVFFEWCIARGYMKHNPIKHMELPKVEKRIPAKLSKQETLRLLDTVYNYPYTYTFLRYRNHAMFSMFIFSGLRKGELLNLHLTDVDIENLSILVRKGKGNKDRVVPMSLPLARTLTKYLEERKRLKKTCPQFFASLNRNKGFTEMGMKYLVRTIRGASGIEFTIHKLRHTFATLMLEGGCDIYSLSKMMGHSEISTTTIYLTASPEHLRSQMMKHPLNV